MLFAIRHFGLFVNSDPTHFLLLELSPPIGLTGEFFPTVPRDLRGNNVPIDPGQLAPWQWRSLVHNVGNWHFVQNTLSRCNAILAIKVISVPG
jgi:hypothetical protein